MTSTPTEVTSRISGIDVWEPVRLTGIASRYTYPAVRLVVEIPAANFQGIDITRPITITQHPKTTEEDQ